MMVKAGGRTAFILMTGLWVFLAGPSDATTADDAKSTGAPVALNKYVKHGSRHGKSHFRRKSGELAMKSDARPRDAGIDLSSGDSGHASPIPPSVANANAQLGPSKASPAAAGNPVDAQPVLESGIVSADQLNEVDRALHEDAPAPAISSSASSPAVTAPTGPPPAMARRSDSSSWDRTSLIGKVFVGFGALLTMASAARMFMA